ncbi:hypothetical protein PLAN_160033 [Planktothrix rubescens CCAP 1459/22]|uniref:Uncharacterized protein n=1 Tax=Planktothrix rubescens CCAP 1459/22 TaxID=329571 RepID=A0A6J7ZIL6_PLARU|nr:hypothetical protein PLAN_160033 [Planktothrix rubescens NIVA-CYA 18]CAD0227478.1 hypothetical protein PL10110_330079 [Planktothrix agardhii]
MTSTDFNRTCVSPVYSNLKNPKNSEHGLRGLHRLEHGLGRLRRLHRLSYLLQ